MLHAPPGEDPLLGRAQIAVLAGVSRSTVTGWEQQEIGFPSPRRSNGQDYFRRSEIIDWLDQRTVPSAWLTAGESFGVTYGDRTRKAEATGKSRRGAARHSPGAGTPYRVPTGAIVEPRPESLRIVAELMSGLVDRIRGAASVVEYLNLLFCLHYLHGAAAKLFKELLRRASTMADLNDAAALLRDIGRAVDEDMHSLGVHSSMREALGRLEPRTARDLRSVVNAMSLLDEDVFGLILDEYEQRAALGSGEFFTPRPVVRLMTDLACSEFGPDKPRSIYDPYARDGGFLIEATAACTVPTDGLPGGRAVRAYGETQRADTWRLATMNLLLHGVTPALDLKRTASWNDNSARAPRQSFDIVLTNPPFNMTDPARGKVREGQWAFGPPPLDNDNLAWVQHCLARLRERGRAGIIMPNKAGNSSHKAELAIRRNLVEAGVVDCVIALPSRLFTGTAVPVSVWLLRHTADPCDSTLFLDARHMGTKNGSRRVLSPRDAESILNAYRACRAADGTASTGGPTVSEHQVPRSVVSREELRQCDYSLNPLDHVERRGQDQDGPHDDSGSSWTSLNLAEEHLREVQDAAERLSLVADRGPAPQRSRSMPTFALSSLCEIQAGPSYSKLGKAQRSADGSVPVVFPRHLRDRYVSDEKDERVSEETARRLHGFALREKDIVCVRSGAILPPALIRDYQGGWLMSPNLIRLRVSEAQKSQVLPEYLFHYLCLEKSVAWMRDRAAATAAPSLRTESLGTMQIPLPHLAEQQEFAAALDSLDALDRAHQAVAASFRHVRTTLTGALMDPSADPTPAATAPRLRSEKEAQL
jgi:type I restriction enzyme M protein